MEETSMEETTRREASARRTSQLPEDGAASGQPLHGDAPAVSRTPEGTAAEQAAGHCVAHEAPTDRSVAASEGELAVLAGDSVEPASGQGFASGQGPDPGDEVRRDGRWARTAQAVSWLLHPFVLPVYVIAVVLTCTVYTLYSPAMKFYLMWVVALYTILIPLLSLGVLRSLGRISDWHVDRRRERIIPLLVGIVCYLLCAMTVAKIPTAVFLRKFMVAAACCEAMCLLVTLRWKISLHMTAMGAVVSLFALMIFIDAGNLVGVLVATVLGTGVLASARLYLGCHNGWQILAGFVGGFLVSTLSMLFF